MFGKKDKSEPSSPSPVEVKQLDVEVDEPLSPPILSVRTYQAVTFDKANETTFLVKGSQRKKKVEVTINERLVGVDIKSKTDHIFVPMTNISCIYFENANSRAKESAAVEESTRVADQNAALTDQSKRPL